MVIGYGISLGTAAGVYISVAVKYSRRAVNLAGEPLVLLPKLSCTGF